jgi:glycosyltransferase involved in cell wall biosynthesis
VGSSDKYSQFNLLILNGHLITPILSVIYTRRVEKASICIVTTEFPGLGPSGGIGSYVKHLIDLLEPIDCEVVVLHCGNSTLSSKNLRLSSNATIVSLKNLNSRNFSGGTHPNFEVSLKVYDWLQLQNFSHINFPDWLGLGTASVMAKKSRIAFQETKLSVTLHGFTSWTREGNTSSQQNLLNLDEDFEHFAVQNCDEVIAPSEYIASWTKSKLNLTKPIQVICNPIVGKTTELTKNDSSEKLIPTICFFGRIEERKGIDVFLAAIDQLDIGKTKISIVGRNILGSDFFSEFKDKKWFQEVVFIEDYSTEQAVLYFRENDALVVIPSKIENCPYVVQEIVGKGLRVLCSSVGGIPELISHENLFSGEVQSLSSRILGFLSDPSSVPHAQPLQNVERNNARWVEFFMSPAPKLVRVNKQQEIGIVIPHFNQSNYLRATLKSILNQTHTNFKCLVIDDGSSREHLRYFRTLASEFQSEKMIFLEEKNHDVGWTRNFGAKTLGTEIVTFLDSDDILDVKALEEISKTDFSQDIIVTTHFSIFEDNPKDSSDFSNSISSYEPLGSISNLSWFRNFLGGSNFSVRNELFLKLGGFTEERNQNHQDWRFLVKAQLSGVEILALPERLLHYRVTPSSMTRKRSHLDGHKSVIHEFLSSSSHEVLLEVASQLMYQTAIDMNQEGNFQLQSTTERLVRKIQNIALKITPYGTRRWKIALKVYRKLVD